MNFIDKISSLKKENAHAKILSSVGILYELYSVYDKKANTYLPPFVAQNDPVAARMILASAQAPDSLMCAYPHDFDLYHIGQMAQSQGNIISDMPRFLGNVAAILSAAMNTPAPQYPNVSRDPAQPEAAQ